MLTVLLAYHLLTWVTRVAWGEHVLRSESSVNVPFVGETYNQSCHLSKE